MFRGSIYGIGIIVAAIFTQSPAFADDTQTLNSITTFASSNCEEVKQSGDATSQHIKGKVDAGVSGLFKQFASADGQAEIDRDTTKYSGLVQNELAKTLNDVRLCKQHIIDLLVPRLLKSSEAVPKNSIPPSEAADKPSAALTGEQKCIQDIRVSRGVWDAAQGTCTFDGPTIWISSNGVTKSPAAIWDSKANTPDTAADFCAIAGFSKLSASATRRGPGVFNAWQIDAHGPVGLRRTGEDWGFNRIVCSD